MKDILVVGGGFAGVWSAAAAARMRAENGADLSITLVAPGDDLVIRPRLYEADPHRMRVPLDRILGPIGVRRMAAAVSTIDTANRVVTTVEVDGRTTESRYRRLVLAAGSRLHRADLPGSEHLFDVDTLESATALARHLREVPPGPGRRTVVVVGAGFTGLEAATELIGRLAESNDPSDPTDRPRVVLVERAGVVGPDLGPGPRPAIVEALNRLGVQVRLGQSVASVEPGTVRFTDGTQLAAGTVVWTAGVRASPLTAQIPGRRDRLGRLHVDENLRVPRAPEVFAAGDTAAAVAEPGRLVLQSCQHAIPLGKSPVTTRPPTCSGCRSPRSAPPRTRPASTSARPVRC